MATKSENADIAVLQSQMKTLMETATRVENKLDTINNVYVTKAEFEEFKQRWFLSHTLAALAGAILSGIIIYIIQKVLK